MDNSNNKKQISLALKAVDKYLTDNKGRWSETTSRSEKARLTTHLPIWINCGRDAAAFFQALEQSGKKPYTIKTTFIRMGNFLKWQGMETQAADIKNFMYLNGKYFKNAYKKERLNVTFEEAEKRITKIGDEAYREAARELLSTGLRIGETSAIVEGRVKGKGGKERSFYGRGSVFAGVDKTKLRRELKKVGLKPHSLRKLFATRLAKSGDFTEADLCEVMGWNSFATAQSYLQPDKANVLADKISNAIGGK